MPLGQMINQHSTTLETQKALVTLVYEAMVIVGRDLVFWGVNMSE